jgi:glycosyltransferase involved in cell wall biosynthesis
MMLYLYLEEWTGRRAREVHTLSTCVALAHAGWPVTLVTAGGEPALRGQLEDVAGAQAVDGLHLVVLSRTIGPVRSAAVFAFRFRRWLSDRPAFKNAFVIHLKASQMVRKAGIPYAFEAHEIFAETRRNNPSAQRALEDLEGNALGAARWRIATSESLAGALGRRYALPNDFHIVPNSGLEPLPESVARSDGPFVYLGSIAYWKGLELVVESARHAQVPLRVVGGTEEEWRVLGARHDLRGVEWRPRVPVREIPQALAGARAGLISTLPESGSGRYSCPMKLFDYARCGLPVLGTDLPSLKNLGLGPWFTPVPDPGVAAWASALRGFCFNAEQAQGALAWAAKHTWSARAEALRRILEHAD